MLRFAVWMQNYLAHSLRRDEPVDRGATAVEYGLMVALIAAVIMVVITRLGTSLSSTFNKVAGGL